MALTDLSTILFITILVIFRVWYTLGGWPEAWYRIKRTEYFVMFIREASGKITRHPLKWSMIKRRSPAMFAYRDGEWIVDEDLQSRSNGRPAWFWNYNDARPIPMGVGKDGKIKDRCDPVLIQKFARNVVIADIHRTGETPKKRAWFGLALLLLTVLFIVGYSTYLIYNIYCGQAPARCR